MTQKELSKEKERLARANAILSEFTSALVELTFDNNFSLAVDEIVNCCKNGSKIVTTGMGKAGKAMQKFSSTLCSFGMPSCYLHPGEASHGDLGLVNKKDILFVASTSGKTREVIEVIDLSRNIGIKCIIGVTSHPDSLIREKADLTLDMGKIREAGELGLAPTTSILVMQVITDCLALVASEELKVTREDFGKYHHSGYSGALSRGDGIIY